MRKGGALVKPAKRLQQALKDLSRPVPPDPLKVELRQKQKAAELASLAVQADRIHLSLTPAVRAGHQPDYRSPEHRAADQRRARRTHRRYSL